MRDVKFIFDLDGTVSKEETLPLISKHFNVQSEIDILTNETVQGNIPFIESFIRRVYILGKLPVSEVCDVLEKVSLYDKIIKFIAEHSDKCVVATGNLECWIYKLSAKIQCQCYCSSGKIQNDKVAKLTHILRKENLVERYKSDGKRVIFIGDGNNDVEAMRLADISIASGLTHMPAKSVLSIADYAVFSEEALCRQLNQLL